jgi:hypothetical protein
MRERGGGRERENERDVPEIPILNPARTPLLAAGKLQTPREICEPVARHREHGDIAMRLDAIRCDALRIPTILRLNRGRGQGKGKAGPKARTVAPGAPRLSLQVRNKSIAN